MYKFSRKSTARRGIAMLTAVLVTAGIFTGCSQNVPSAGEETAASQSVSETAGTTAASSAEGADEGEESISAPPRDVAPVSTGDIVSVTADTMQGSLAAADTAFTVKTSSELEPERLKAYLSLTPDVPFEITKQDALSYSLKTAEPLPENSMAVIGLKNDMGDIAYKWAFQTDGGFEVRETYPYGGSEYVTPSTGIEISFTALADNKNAEDYFEIVPEVKGRFESRRDTLYFIPSESLDEVTTYTVTLKKGLTSADGAVLEEDYSFSFKTSDSGGHSYCYDSGVSETFLSDDMPLIQIFCSDGIKDNDFSVELYRYDSADGYYNALKGFIDSGLSEENYNFAADGLENVYSETVKLVNSEDSWGPSYLLLPEELEEGFYFALVKTEENGKTHTIQRHIQINPVSVYASMLSGKAQFFINDTSTGKAASNADIKLHTKMVSFNTKTDSNGVAELEFPTGDAGTGLLKIECGDNIYCDIFDIIDRGNEDYSDLYYTYIYTDREIYKRDDTVNVWGVIRPRKEGVKLPDDLTLRFGDTYESGWDIPFEINEDGTFSAQNVFTDAGFEWGTSINLVTEGESICRKYFRIEDYVKPTYTFETDIPYYAVSPQSEPVAVTVDAKLFDGTAADGLTFEASAYDVDHAEPSVMTTDEKGHAEAKVYFKDSERWQPVYLWLNLEMTGVQNEYTDAGMTTIGFFRDVMLEYDYDKDKHSMEIKTSRIEPDRYEQGDDTYSDETFDKIRGEAADADVEVIITRNYSEKIEDGTYYDYLRKENVTKYRYEYREERVGTYNVSTVNGRALLEDLPTNHEDSSYYIEFIYNDSQGRKTVDSGYISNYTYDDYGGKKYYTLSSESYEFKEGQSLALKLQENGQDVSYNNGRAFLQIHGTEFIDSKVYAGTEYNITMSSDYIPTVNITGAYFDGTHIYPINEGWQDYSFDPEDREIILELSSDKEKYAPGDKVKVTVSAKDVKGGVISGAAVNLSVADEAVFAVASQYADPLEEIYADIYLPWVQQYYSYEQYSMEADSAGEMGGGGDDGGARKDFRDTAAFMSAVTDSKGQAVFEFDLPDNITEWRTTAVSVYEKETDVLYAGAAKLPVIATQPLFIEAVMLSEIVEGDDLSVSARCFGETAGDDVITVNVHGDGVDETKTAPSGRPVNFGKLAKGEYTVTFSAGEGEASDKIELPLTVTDTLLEARVNASADLAEGLDIKPSKWPVCITFFDSEYMLYTDVLFKLTEQAGTRIDMRIASAFAMKQLGFMTEQEYLAQFSGITRDGLVPLMENSAGNVQLTAKLCAAAPELIDKLGVKNSMYNILNDENSYSGDAASAYLALAALGEPVMTEIRGVLEKGVLAEGLGDMAYEDGLKLTAALALLGDYDGAQKYYSQFTPVTSAYADDDGNELVFVSGDYPVELTQTALMTAAVLGLPEADGMARYLISSEQVYDSFAPELMIYLAHYTPENEGDAEFTYSLDGKTETVKLDRHFGTHIDFGREQFENADFKVVSGGVYAVSSFKGHPVQNDTDPELKVEKTYTSHSGDFEIGSLVTVTIKVTGSDCKFSTVNDVVPSCGRFDDSVTGWYADREGQNVKIWTDEHGIAKYTFRIASSGEYLVESAAARNCNGQWGISEKSVITVKGYDAAA